MLKNKGVLIFLVISLLAVITTISVSLYFKRDNEVPLDSNHTSKQTSTSFVNNTDNIVNSYSGKFSYYYRVLDAKIVNLDYEDKGSYLQFKVNIYHGDLNSDIDVLLFMRNKKIPVIKQLPFDGKLEMITIEEFVNMIERDKMVRLTYLSNFLDPVTLEPLSIVDKSICGDLDIVCKKYFTEGVLLPKTNYWGLGDGGKIISESIVKQ